MGAGPFSSDSTTKAGEHDIQYNVASTDQARSSLVRGKGASSAQDSIVAHKGGKIQTGGVQLAGKASLTNVYNTSDPDVLRNALEGYQHQAETFSSTLRDVLSSQTSTTTAQSSALQQALADQAAQSSALQRTLAAQAGQSGTLQEALAGKLSDLAANVQSGGDAGRNKIVLWVVLAALALLGLFLWKGR